ncbi:MAG TPA: pitrilysin family protein [Candidatus Eisenbacteria bacterium]|nr:pitrilysin family protein [Candidatus Eisenbacteria bacterium]
MQFEKVRLPNGLEVILRPDHRLPIVAVNLWYHVGPANETRGRTGFAHLFEHMMFQGSGHVPEDAHFRLLEGAGASLINGTTDFDRTNYLEDLPSNQLELALWLESDRMGFLLDRLDATMLANQQDVVRNERRQSVENAPYGLVAEHLWHMLFPEGHPYYASVIGSHEDIQAARLEDVRDFFRRYYAPNNASLAIVGDIDLEKTKKLVEKYFGSIPPGPPVPRIEVVTPPLVGERRAIVTDQVELPRLAIAWLSPPIFKAGDAEAEMTARILGGGKASRFYKRLVYDDKIAQSVSAGQFSYTLGSVFEISATAKPGHTADDLEREVDQELARFAAHGPTSAEVDGARNAIQSSIWMSLESVGGFSGVADRLNRYNHHLGSPDYLEKDLARYDAITPASLRQFAREWLSPNRRVIVHGVPGEKVLPPDPPAPPTPERDMNAEVTLSGDPWRETIPVAAVASRPTLPRPRRFQLDNGLTVFLAESHTLPVVAADLVLRSGSAVDPTGQHGLAGFTFAMLDEGSANRDALGLARELESLGAFLNSSAGSDGSYIWIRCLKPKAHEAMRLWSDVALSPAFPENEIERVRNERLTALLQRRDSPSQTATRVLYPSLYGPEHPYGHIVLGDERALRRIARADLERFYRDRFSPADAALVFAGDLTEDEARALAEKGFGSWRGKTPANPSAAQGKSIPERVVIVDKPDSPQTSVLVAQLGVPRSHPDFEPLSVMNQILGGLFSSRVNMNLRERHGYTYGAYSGVTESRGVGMFYIGASVRTDATGASIREMFREVEGIRQDPVTEEELLLAKDSIVRALPAMFETTETTVSTLGTLFVHDLPLDFFERLPGRIEAMTAPQILDATRRHLDPERMIVVAVGDRAKIDPQIAELGLGAVTYRDADGKRIDG